MSIESREDAARLAQQMIERDAQITALIEELRTKDMRGLECGETVQLEALSENAAAASLLARWVLDLPLPLSLPPPQVRPQISLVLIRPDSPPDSPPACVKMGGIRVTPTMLEAAEDLLHTLTTGERQLPKDLYEVVARGFCTTPADARERILRAIYGGRGAPMPPPPEEPSV